jgi:type IV pilus assembly protein PilQ
VKIISDYLTGGSPGANGQQGASGFAEQQGRAKVDNRTSNIIVRDTVEVIERIKKIVEVLDTETPQILIESKIVEVQDQYELRAGLGGATGITGSYNPLLPGSDFGTQTGVFSFSSAPTTASPTVLSGAIEVYKRITGLDFALDLMESETKGRIVSSPKIITQNNESATITSDQVISVLTQQQATSDAVGPLTSLETLTASLSLSVTPRVTNDGSINMKVEISKGSFGNQEDPSQPPPQTNNSMSTNVLVDNGSTIVVGGIHTTSEREVETGIPFLKDLPLIGWLFRNAYNPRSEKAELVVFITPRIINQEEAGLVNRDAEGLGI